MSAAATPKKGAVKKPGPDEPCDPAAIVELCVEAGAPTMAASLIREGVSVAEARTRVDYVGKVGDVVAMARKTMPGAAIPVAFADEAIRTRMPLAKVREALFERMAAADEALPAVMTIHRAGAGGTDTPGATTDADARKQSKAAMVKQLKAQGLKPNE